MGFQAKHRRGNSMSAATVQVEVKERPIIFSGPMVKAILEGRKTQTRRVAKVTSDGCKPGFITPVAGFVPRSLAEHVSYCPYGWVDDRLWVRETWAPHDAGVLANEEREHVYYRADDETKYETDGAWRSPIHMPRWASRITIEIINVRVERLQEISEADIRAEGIDEAFCEALGETAHRDPDLVEAWAHGWDSINAKRGYSWESNPWVWAITFKKL